MVNLENVVDNICVWDGDINTWQPPQGYTMLVQATTPAMIWKLNTDKTNYVLTEEMGMTDIGFTWNGTVCTTNESKPQTNTLATQPVTEGTQTI